MAERSGESGARANAILDATAEGGAREEIRAPRTPAERTAAGLSRESARDAFGVGFRVAALAALLTVPFALILRRFVVSEAPEDEPASAA